MATKEPLASSMAKNELQSNPEQGENRITLFVNVYDLIINRKENIN